MADTSGCKYFSGVLDGVVVVFFDCFFFCTNEKERIAIGRAMDRILLWGFYAIPHFNLPAFRVAYWRKIEMPTITPPYGIDPYLWWARDTKMNATKKPKS